MNLDGTVEEIWLIGHVHWRGFTQEGRSYQFDVSSGLQLGESIPNVVEWTALIGAHAEMDLSPHDG